MIAYTKLNDHDNQLNWILVHSKQNKQAETM